MKIHFPVLALFLAFSLVSIPVELKERLSGTIGAGTPSLADKQLAKEIGIRLSKSYSATRLQLIKLSWQPATNPDLVSNKKPVSFPNYPEILCGEGMDAICTARFNKNGNAVILTVNQHKRSLPVVHIMKD